MSGPSATYFGNNNNNNKGRSARHHALNDLIARSFASAGVPVTKEPIGLFRSDGKKPDGLTLVPWQSGKSLCWDVTVSCPLAESYVTEAAREAGAAAELAATRKEVKYSGIVGRHMFEPIAVETLGIFNASAIRLLNDLGRRISSISGDTRETSHLYQQVSVLVQRFNAVCYTTACRSLTARTKHHTLSVYFRQFLNLPRK